MTPTEQAARWLADVPRYSLCPVDGKYISKEGNWVRYDDAIAAIARHLAPGDDLVAQATAADLDGLLHAARELAQYASYAEIVGGVSVNRPQVRKWCDAVFAAIKTMPEDEGFEPVAPNITALLARIAALTATVAGKEDQLVSVLQREAETQRRHDAKMEAAEREAAARLSALTAEAATLRDRLARMEGALQFISDDLDASEEARVLAARAALTDGGSNG